MLCLGLVVAATAEARGQSPPTSATIDVVPLTLTMPERFQIVSTLEPIRHVSLVAPADGRDPGRCRPPAVPLALRVSDRSANAQVSIASPFSVATMRGRL
jgi:hypothetical protein